MVNFTRMRTLMRRISTAESNVRKAWSVATKCTQTFSDMPGGGQRESQVERGGDLHMEAVAVLRALRRELKAQQEELRALLPSIEDENAREALEMRYIEGKSVIGVAVATGYSKRHAIRKIKDGEMAVMICKEAE